MIAAWMLYALIVGGLASAAAALCDRVLRGLRLPTRGVWVTALVFSVAWPVVAMVVPRDVAAPAVQPVASTPLIGATLQRVTIFATQGPSSALPVSVDAIVLAMWLALSLLLGVRLVRDVRSLAVRREAWANGDVDGVRIRLSHDTGPGVVGLNPMEVVFPSWALGLDTPLRSLVLRHEEEHRRARDPFLLAFATVLFVLLPWNVGVWWQARRLRLAVELDCDARVLGAEPHLERYGLLLLTIAQRRSNGIARLITGLLEPAQHLGERITAMQSPSRPVSRMRAVLFTTLAAGFVVLACTMNAPRDPVSPSAVARERADSVLIVKPETVRFVVDSTRYVLDKMRYTLDSVRVVLDQIRQIDVRPLQVDVKPMTIEPKHLQVEVKPLIAATWPLQVDVKPVIVETKPLFIDVKPVQVRVRPDTIPPVEVTSIVDVQLPPVRTIAPLTVEIAKIEPVRQLVPSTVHIVAPPVAGSVAPPTNVPPVVVQGTVVTGPTPDNQPVLYDFQVEVPARWIQGTGTTKYPIELKEAGINGSVIASFVVDTTGKAIMSTFRIMKSSHERFSESVSRAVPTMRFKPAELTPGHKVYQLVQHEFAFTIRP